MYIHKYLEPCMIDMDESIDKDIFMRKDFSPVSVLQFYRKRTVMVSPERVIQRVNMSLQLDLGVHTFVSRI
jgi:hypothetical protein